MKKASEKAETPTLAKFIQKKASTQEYTLIDEKDFTPTEKGSLQSLPLILDIANYTNKLSIFICEVIVNVSNEQYNAKWHNNGVIVARKTLQSVAEFAKAVLWQIAAKQHRPVTLDFEATIMHMLSRSVAALDANKRANNTSDSNKRPRL